jgi:hypothetical protein
MPFDIKLISIDFAGYFRFRLENSGFFDVDFPFSVPAAAGR